MKTPGWAIFVGIMMILVGGCGVLSDAQAIMSPKLLAMNDDFLEQIEEDLEEETKRDSLEERSTIDTSEHSEIEEIQNDSFNLEGPGLKVSGDSDDFPADMKGLLKISDHYKTWIVRFGYIGIFFSLLYIISGIFMMVRKKFSLKLAYITLGACILFALIQIFILTMGEKNIFTIGSSASAGGGLLLDLIFIIIITACDTEAYEPESFEQL